MSRRLRPINTAVSFRGSAGGQAEQAVSGPAISLIVVSIISIGLLVLAIPFDLFLLVTGAAEPLRRPPGHSVRVAVRLAWDCVIFGASCYVLYGAYLMKQLSSLGHAKAAAIVACIPCVGPCCLLGIPFGAWALTVLGQEEVAKSFDS